MQQMRRTSVAVALVGAVAIGGVASAAAGAPPRPGHAKVTGGSSKITLSRSSLKALKHGGYKLAAIRPARYNGKTLSSPIKSGNFSITGSADVNVAGGFKISHGGKSVSVTKLHSTSSTSGGSGTAVVTGHGRILAIKTGQGTLSTGPGTIKSSNFTVTLAKPLVRALNRAFGTTLFKKHAHIGRGSATIRY